MAESGYPLITVGITCFNAEDTIARAIFSAFSQDWPNLEILIVDDCSTDRSVSVIEEIIKNDKRAKLIRHKINKGPAAARNTLLRNAEGEFIAFFDDDDVSMKNRVSTQVGRLLDYETKTGCRRVACYARGIRYYPNGYKKPLPAIGSKGEKIPNGSGVANYLLFYQKRYDWFYGAGVPACSLMARVSLFKEVGWFDECLRRVEDADFAVRLALKGGHFIGTTEPLFIQYATSSLDKSPEKNLESEQEIVRKHKAYLVSIGYYYYALHWPELRYWHFKRQYFRFISVLTRLFLRYPIMVLKHLLSTGPRRLLHEHKMRRKFSQ